MAYGLQIFDAAGNLVVDVVDRLTRFHSSYYVTVTVGTPVFVPVAGMQDNGLWAITSAGEPLISNVASVTIGAGGFTITAPGTPGASTAIYVVVFMI